jgi:hypothetical protein
MLQSILSPLSKNNWGSYSIKLNNISKYLIHVLETFKLDTHIKIGDRVTGKTTKGNLVLRQGYYHLYYLIIILTE